MAESCSAGTTDDERAGHRSNTRATRAGRDSAAFPSETCTRCDGARQLHHPVGSDPRGGQLAASRSSIVSRRCTSRAGRLDHHRRRPRQQVVGRRHAGVVGAGRRHGQQVARVQLGQLEPLDQHVARTRSACRRCRRCGRRRLVGRSQTIAVVARRRTAPAAGCRTCRRPPRRRPCRRPRCLIDADPVQRRRRPARRSSGPAPRSAPACGSPCAISASARCAQIGSSAGSIAQLDLASARGRSRSPPPRSSTGSSPSPCSSMNATSQSTALGYVPASRICEPRCTCSPAGCRCSSAHRARRSASSASAGAQPELRAVVAGRDLVVRVGVDARA